MLAGIATHRARIGYEGLLTTKVRLHNHKSASEQPQVLADGIEEDLALGRIRRLESLPDAYYISPLGLVPKKSEGQVAGWRRIHDLSAPTGHSVNDGIPKHYSSIVYETFQHALSLIGKSGRGTVLIKRDPKSAFRGVPVSPYDGWLLMYMWAGKIFMELFLPFGLCTAPIIFNLFSEAIHWIMSYKGWDLCHYIYDFLLVLPPGSASDTQKAADEFSGTCDAMGFTIE